MRHTPMSRKTCWMRGAARGDCSNGIRTWRAAGSSLVIWAGLSIKVASSRPTALCSSASSWWRREIHRSSVKRKLTLTQIHFDGFHTPWSLLRISASFSSWICIISFCLLVSCNSSLMPFFFFISCETKEESKCVQTLKRPPPKATQMMVRRLYLLQLQFNDLFLVGVGFVLSLHVGFLGAFFLGTAARAEVNKWETDTDSSGDFCVGGEAVRYLWMMVLSYSCPSGVSMMAYSSLVTWSRAGRESPSVTWLITRGNNLFGERLERAPTAFFSAWGEKRDH